MEKGLKVHARKRHFPFFSEWLVMDSSSDVRALAERLKLLAEQPWEHSWFELQQALSASAAALLRSSPPAESRAWQPIETLPSVFSREALFWIRPKTAEEAGLTRTVDQFCVDDPPCIFKGYAGGWSSLSKATHWLPLPEPPTISQTVQKDETDTAEGAQT